MTLRGSFKVSKFGKLLESSLFCWVNWSLHRVNASYIAEFNYSFIKMIFNQLFFIRPVRSNGTSLGTQYGKKFHKNCKCLLWTIVSSQKLVSGDFGNGGRWQWWCHLCKFGTLESKGHWKLFSLEKLFSFVFMSVLGQL